ncbi:MAG TPA: hypothetical protein GXX75_24380 [Clostridiales bacterium]|nr:hypothetical protein [Clostridiales bacterium]
MKSDQEFLKGVYEKARLMESQEEESVKKTVVAPKTMVYLRWGAVAAALVLIFSSGVFMQNWRKAALEDEIQNPGISTARIDALDDIPQPPGDTPQPFSNISQPLDQASEVVELEPLQNTRKAPGIAQIYKASVDEATILSVLEKNGVYPDPEKNTLVLLKIEGDSSQILEVLTLDEQTGDYMDSLGGKIAKEELEIYFNR